MKIKFISDYKVQSFDGEMFKRGQVLDFDESSANHFLNRGVAVIDSGKQESKAKEDCELTKEPQKGKAGRSTLKNKKV